MLRPLTTFAVLLLLFIGGALVPSTSRAAFHFSPQGQTTPQQPRPTATPAPVRTEPTPKVDKNQKTFTAEQIAESAIFIYGSRPVLEQIRRNGVERGRFCRPTCDAGEDRRSHLRAAVCARRKF